MKKLNILGICGSRRLNSANGLILKAVKSELNSHHWLDFDLATLPFFDPDNQYGDATPQVVLTIRKLASQSDVILISTPEYAHGIPGMLKNALEWIFHDGTLKKPVFVIIGSGQGEHTKDQLIEVLSTMDFSINSEQVLLIKGARSKIDSKGNLLDKRVELDLKNFCKKLISL